MKPITIAQITELSVRVTGQMAEQRIESGSSDPWDFALAAYAKASPDERSSFNEHLRDMGDHG